MVDDKSQDLIYRLSSCLETILELERDIERLELGQILHGEFEFLKSFLSKVETFAVQEDDVVRIEKATANFLKELHGPLSSIESRLRTKRMLQ